MIISPLITILKMSLCSTNEYGLPIKCDFHHKITYIFIVLKLDVFI